jgi:hypothetical protein
MMWKLTTLAAAAAVMACALAARHDAPADEAGIYLGAADASAAEFIDATTLVVADDEDNVLRFYDALAGGAPRLTLDLSEFLGLSAEGESDIEGAARVGDRIYWVTSHGRNRKGKERRGRGRLFATEIVHVEGRTTLRPVGRAYRELVPALVSALEAHGIPLAAAVGIDADGRMVQQDKRLAPKAGGLNIEGLAACPDGRCLYLGLRNPRHTVEGAERAIVAPLLNPAAVVDRGELPRIGPPLLWDLGGQGVRSMHWSAEHSAFLIVAGDHGEGGASRLYRWSGDRAATPTMASPAPPFPSDLNPEALIELPGGKRLLVLSDDGDRRIRVGSPADCTPSGYRKDGTCRNKEQRDADRKSFRGFQFAL